MVRSSGESSGANRKGGQAAGRYGNRARTDQKKIKLEVLVFGWVVVLVIAVTLISP